MRHIILSSVACPDVTYFSTLLGKGTFYFGEKGLLIVKGVFQFSLQHLAEKFLIL